MNNINQSISFNRVTVNSGKGQGAARKEAIIRAGQGDLCSG